MLYKQRGDGMNHFQFHSELTCDEVWYRLNVLLQSLAVCGAKRCEVRGELTDWGCYLWLRNPDGHGGTPVPLRLWTEEGQSPGCVIAGAFQLTGREWRGLLIGGAGVCLEVFLAEMVCGTPLFGALLAGLWTGGIAAAVLYFLLFGSVRFFSRKRERELLQWIQKYLLLREPEGVLLPDAETQRAEWTGLPWKARATEKRRFIFRCALPPEELPAAVETWISQQRGVQEGGRVKWSARWRGPRLKLSRTEIEEGQREAGSLEIFAGWFKTWQFANPFYGVAEPDGQGGSMFRGAFRHRPESFLPLAISFFVIFCCLWQVRLLWLSPLLIFLTAAGAVLQLRRSPVENPGSRAILEFLQTYFEEV